MFLPSFLFSPQELQRMRQAEQEATKRRYERNKHRAEAWDLWRTKPPRRLNEPLIIKGETYDLSGRTLFDCRPTRPQSSDSEKPETYVASPDGEWRYYNYRLPVGHPLSVPIFQERDNQPEVFFTTDVIIPTLTDYEGRTWKPWMSLTPAEVFSARSGIRFCRGNVVIGGLGLGWFASEVVKRRQVTKVTVVEKSQVLLDWYGNALCKKLGVEVICDDIWNVVGKQPAGTRYAIDIWKNWFTASYDSDLRKARQAGHSIWAWGSARG